MTTAQFKRVARILKAAYKKAEEEAKKSGVDLMSPSYESLIDRVRLTVLTEMGYTLEEYRKAKARAGGNDVEESKPQPKAKKVLKSSVAELDKIAKQKGIVKGSPEYLSLKKRIESAVSSEMDVEVVSKKAGIPFEAEMREIATEIAKQVIPPPQVLKEIYSYDDTKLQSKVSDLKRKVDGIKIPDIEKRDAGLKQFFHDNFSENFKKNIDMLGMPDFRKLSLGLLQQIDEVRTLAQSGSGDVVGPASSTDNALARFDSTTGKLIQNSGVIVDDSNNVSGIADLAMTGSLGTTGARLTKGWFTDLQVTNAITGSITGNAATATALLNARTIGGVSFDGTANITVATATGGFTVSGGNLALGTNSLTMTGSIAATGSRVTKGWFTDIESTNMPTVGGTSLSSTFAPIASPTFTGTVVLPTTSLTGVLTLAENTSIALDPAGSADGKYSGITIAGTAGATLAFGDLVYLASADSRWELADADSATTADRMLGICVLAAASDGDPTTILLVGNIRADAAFPALTIGSPVYVGETAGDVQTAIPTGADNVIRRVGYALTADELYFNPSMDSQTTVA